MFTAMANPCELLIDAPDDVLARHVTSIAAEEALRIERKFSRYRDDGAVHAINSSGGMAIEVDAETAQLIDFGVALWHLSDGAFDLTSGALRRVWKMGDQAQPPSEEQLRAILQHIGWHRVNWQSPSLRLPAGMELDFGGIGKEYAVDRVVDLLAPWPELPVLVNFGGDLRTAGPPPRNGAWQVGIESVQTANQAVKLIKLRQGALATSGDTYRALTHNGRRYGHILDARTGWPSPNTPRSVTVAADTCSQAGSYTTLAMLRGDGAEGFLESEQVKYWCFR